MQNLSFRKKFRTGTTATVFPVRAKKYTTLFPLFANIDYDLHIPQEKYYQTVFYLIFTLIGLRVSAEVLVLSRVEAKTNIGRIDAVIEDREIFLFEFKFSGNKDDALAQIKKNKYFEKYAAQKDKHPISVSLWRGI